MKKLLLVVLMTGLFTTFGFADTITLVSDEWCPINCIPGAREPGFMVEVTRTVFSNEGHIVEYKKVPWERAIAQTRKGKYNAIIGAYVGDAPDFVFPENEQGMIGNAFYTLKENNWNFSGTDSLVKLRLGVIKGYDYGESINTYINDPKNLKMIQLTFGETPLELNIKKLIKARVDTVLESEYVFNYKISQMGHKDKIRFAGVAAPPDKAFIAFSPVNEKSKEYARILSDGMTKIRKSGELKKILAKYGLDDWK